MLIPFGFYKDNTGTIRVDNTKAETIQLIFELCLNGFSPKRITEHVYIKHLWFLLYLLDIVKQKSYNINEHLL